MDTLISIIVPIYNVEEYLENCLISIQNQTYKNIEVLMVNDGSKDDSISIMERFANNDKRFVVIRKENGGLSDARNFGMDYAKGQYFLFIDGDDIIEKEMVEVMLGKAITEDCEIVACDMLYQYPDGSSKLASGGSFTKASFSENHDLILVNNSACNKLYHRSLFDDISFIKGLWYEDLATIPVLLAKANSVYKVDAPYYIYVQRGGSIVHTANKKIFDIYTSIEYVKEYFSRYHLDSSIINQLYIIHALDLTTLRIKDFDDKGIRAEYLSENMALLNQYYPDWYHNELVQDASLKKRIIYTLLKLKCYQLVLLLYWKKGN